METISSKTNQYLKLARSLKEKKYREREGLYLVEGLRLAEEAVTAHKHGQAIRIAYALISEQSCTDPRMEQLIADLRAYDVAIYLLAPELLNYCADTVQPQGVLLVLKTNDNHQEKQALLAGDKSFWVVADAVQDPGNLGTILRSAWATGSDGIVLLPGSVDRYNPKVVRASMGAIFNLPIYQAADNDEARQLLLEGGMDILVTAADGRSVYEQQNLTRPVAWVLGSEAHGVCKFWRQAADGQVSLPMMGGAESLNVAMAATVLFYETLRQRLSTK